jgi:NTE family protein
MRVAFVLSGGASLGASQTGMLQALYEHGIRPDLLVGTSAGAINAAFIASRPPTPSTAADLQRIWRGLRRAHVFPANPLTAGMGMLGLRDYSVSAAALRRLVLRHLEFDRLEDAPVELHVVAANALSGEEVLLSSGPAIDAVLASTAIPGVFPAVRWGAQLLIDGGTVNNTPISHAVALGADRIVVLQAIGTGPLGRAPRGVWASGVIAMLRAITRRLQEDIARYANSVELTVIPAPRLDGIMPIDFGHADELITAGLRSANWLVAQPRHAAPLRASA